LPEFGEDRPVRRLTTEWIDAYRTRLLTERTLSPDAVRQNLTALNGILVRAVKNGWIAQNPADRAEKVETPKPSGDFNVLTPVQVDAVARAAAADWEPLSPGERNHTRISDARAAAWTEQRRKGAAQYAAIIRVAAMTGLRMGELRALRWEDVDWGNGVLHVRHNAPTSAPAGSEEKAPKSGLVRSVPLTDQATVTLDTLSKRDRLTDHDDLVFPAPTGAMIGGDKVRGAFYRALAAAGLGHLREKENPITVHDLRHTFGTLAVRAPRTSIKDVQAWMGHKDIKTTMRYLHHVPQHDAGRRLSEAFAVDATGEPVAGAPLGAPA
jgi:integrase